MSKTPQPAKPSDGWAWVTGAGKGLGRALALELAGRGWSVLASARTREDLESLSREAESLSGSVTPLVLDVTDREAVADALKEVEAQRPIALAVLNAGTHQAMAAKDFDPAVFDKLLALNVGGPVNCLAPLIAAMRGRGRGQIAVVASVAGYMGLPTAAAYGLSKAGVINLCESLRPELEREGILLQVVNPGFVRTPLTDRNEFEMPFLMEPDAAAKAFADGLESARFEIYFPKLFVRLMKLLRILPYGLALGLTRRTLPKEERAKEEGAKEGEDGTPGGS
jgi:short-subunit dehydrogenase